MKKYISIILLFFITMIVMAESFPYRLMPILRTMPSEELHCLFMDQQGMMWMGTNVGLKSYDGYTVKSYVSNAFTPKILPNNNILCIEEDHNDHLWIGTRGGLVRMDKKTGKFKTYFLPKENQRVIYTLYIDRKGRLWIGTDNGVTYYDAQNDSFHNYTTQNSWVITPSGKKIRQFIGSVKTFTEDNDGVLYLGTWSNGLYRMKPNSNIFYAYPPINNKNSVYSLVFDHKKRLWVGSWGEGMQRLNHPERIQQPDIISYPYKTHDFDTYYHILEDTKQNMIWACSREGIALLDMNKPQEKWQKYTSLGHTRLDFCYCLLTDQNHNIWVGTMNYGIIPVNTNPTPFSRAQIDLNRAPFLINAINCIYTADGNTMWLGLNPYGLALYNRQTNTTLYNQDITGLENVPQNVLSTKISSIIKRDNGEIWLANGSFGVIIRYDNKPARVLSAPTTPYIADNFVNTLYQSRDHTMWIGQRSALSIVYPNGKGTILKIQEKGKDFSFVDVRNIIEDHHGDMWVSTDNEGIIRIRKNKQKGNQLQFHQYCQQNGNFAINDATACFEDSYHRLWAISASSGLFLYQAEQDRFISLNRKYHIDGECIYAINEDNKHHIWLTTNYGLVKLDFSHNASPIVTTYTEADGIGETFFPAGSTYKYQDELFWGQHNTILSLTPEKIDRTPEQQAHLILSDILIDDASLEELDSTKREEITTLTAQYCREITIPSTIRKISFNFSLLNYTDVEHNKYAYKLEGYDEHWQYLTNNKHRAIFQNLPSGNYKLHVRAMDNTGIWHDMGYELKVNVLPAWYASTGAKAIYLLLLLGIIYLIQKMYQRRIQDRNKANMNVFLTNITHELLTPLTVISAAIDQMKDRVPQLDDDYAIIQNNVKRLSRLFRQILEMRKSQAGKLRLQVSKGDIAAFVRQECENIGPMGVHRNNILKTQIPNSYTLAWFDPDKLDKIIYNLLSNAFKYNRPGGEVKVRLKLHAANIILEVEDQGIGIAKNKQKNLYSRFLDGDYRKVKTEGTGLGLAITNQLVRLHHGTITYESKQNVGTTFRVTLPIRKSDYTADEIDQTGIVAKKEGCINHNGDEKKQTEKMAIVIPPKPKRKTNYTILIVEDNLELLQLMQKILGNLYHIITAKNGSQAWNIIQKESLDLVISDIMMPIMDGLELTRLIKTNHDYQLIPVVLLTAKTTTEDKNKGLEAGADDFMNKPFSMEELKMRIANLLDNRKNIQRLIQETEDFKLNLHTNKHISNPDQIFINHVNRLIHDHIEDAEYGREQLAEDLNISSSTLYNRVKALTGKSIVEYITHIRMLKASEILTQQPRIHVVDLALMVGFNTPKYFSKCFKKEFGVSPKEYSKVE